MKADNMAANVQAHVAVQQLIFRLFYCLDTRDYPGVVSSFREDAVWVRLGKRLAGRAQMMQALKERSPTMVIHHIITNLHFESEATDHCKAVCYLTAYRHDAGKPFAGPTPLKGPSQVGVCRAEARHCGDGTWLLSYLNADNPAFMATS